MSLARWGRRVLVAIVPVLLLGCTGSLTYDDPLPAEIPARAAVAGVPLIEQADFYCGPASLAMVLSWAGRDTTQDQIAAMAFSPGAKGTYRSDMLGTARRQGMLAVELSSFPELLSEVTAGHPVIVFQNLGLNWLPRWHYGVVVGFDRGREEMYLNSGELSRLTMEFPVFERTWRRGDYWALVVLPPEELPETADQWDVLRAAAALERTGHHAAAAEVYATGAETWTDNWLWPFGLGNALYAQGDLRGAARAYRRALAIEPDAPEAKANLAEVSAELARRNTG